VAQALELPLRKLQTFSSNFKNKKGHVVRTSLALSEPEREKDVWTSSPSPGLGLSSLNMGSNVVLAAACRGRLYATRDHAPPLSRPVTCLRRGVTPGSSGRSGAGSNERGARAGVLSAPSRGGRTGQWGPHRGGVLVSGSGWKEPLCWPCGREVGARETPPPEL
jgi:hypothetical protein